MGQIKMKGLYLEPFLLRIRLSTPPPGWCRKAGVFPLPTFDAANIKHPLETAKENAHKPSYMTTFV
jgi:hypothetical protein